MAARITQSIQIYLQKNPGPRSVAEIAKACNSLNTGTIRRFCEESENITRIDTGTPTSNTHIQYEWTAYNPFSAREQYNAWCKANDIKQDISSSQSIVLTALRKLSHEEVRSEPIDTLIQKVISKKECSRSYLTSMRRSLTYLKKYFETTQGGNQQ